MTLEAKYRHAPELSTLDLSDVVLEADAHAAALSLEAVAGFLRVLDALEHVEPVREWLRDADELENLAETLGGVAESLLARQQEAES